MAKEWRTRRLSRRYVLIFVSMLALLAFAATASGNLTGSTFDGVDGNLVLDDEAKDWANVGIDCVDDPSPAGDERNGCGLDKPTGNTDDSFGEGTSENDDPPSVVDGSIPNNKSDLTRFYVASEKAAGKDFLYLAWERVQEPSGTTNMDFEFNQSETTSSNGVTPVRTLDDLLVKYDLSQGGTNPTLGFHRWETQAGNSGATSATARAAICEAGNKFPCWGKVQPLVGNFEGAVNQPDPVSDPIGPNAPRSLSARTFGEAAINLTDSGLFPAGSCTNFGSGYLKSRSSDSFTAAIKDFIAPIEVNVSNCGSIELKKALVPSTDAGRFNLFIKKGAGGVDGAVDSASNVGDGGTTGPNTVLGGTYNVSETAVAGTTLSNYTTSVACVDSGDNSSVSVNGSGDLSVAADQDVVCTITNTLKTGKIELLKDFVGTAESVTLKIGTAQGGSQVDSQVLTADGTTGENTVPIGNHFVSEALTTPANYTSSLACVNDLNDDDAVDANDTVHTVNSGTGEVAVGENEDVLCRFINTRKTGKIELLKRFVGATESVTIKIGTSQGGSETDWPR